MNRQDHQNEQEAAKLQESGLDFTAVSNPAVLPANPTYHNRPAYHLQLVREAGVVLADLPRLEMSADAAKHFREHPEMADEGIEKFAVCYMDVKHKVIFTKVHFQGSVNSCNIYIREVIKYALFVNAKALVLCHNHPSGSIEPSWEDMRLTEDLEKACELFELSVLDHVILGDPEDRPAYFSFADRGRLTKGKKQC